jgi:3alpha(or 20beta)-hydroxysteroid dehydrogenase
VTGAANGIGAAISRLFAGEGARVVVGDIDDDAGKGVVTDIGVGTRFVHHDVTSEADWEGAVTAAIQSFGGLNVLVNNAGVVHRASLADTSVADYERVVRVNQVGVFLGMRAVVPAMRRSGGGSIVNVSSVRGLSGAPGLLAYTATKFAVRGMTKVAALELGAYGIRVNSLHPGPVATGIGGDVSSDGDAMAAYLARQPLARFGQPDELARVALFLASDDSSYCTGAEFVADGGQTAGVIR